MTSRCEVVIKFIQMYGIFDSCTNMYSKNIYSVGPHVKYLGKSVYSPIV